MPMNSCVFHKVNKNINQRQTEKKHFGKSMYSLGMKQFLWKFLLTILKFSVEVIGRNIKTNTRHPISIYLGIKMKPLWIFIWFWNWNTAFSLTFCKALVLECFLQTRLSYVFVNNITVQLVMVRQGGVAQRDMVAPAEKKSQRCIKSQHIHFFWNIRILISFSNFESKLA